MNPWKAIFDQTLGDVILTTAEILDSDKARVVEEAAKYGITAETIGEKWLDAQIAAAELTFPVALFRTQLISAINGNIQKAVAQTGNATNAVFDYIMAWAKVEANKLIAASQQ